MSTTQPRLHDVDPTYLTRAQAVLDTLQSFFIEMPRGGSFVEREDFQLGYVAFKQETRDGTDLSGAALLRAIRKEPRAWLVLRTIVGMSPGEAAWLAVEEAAARGEELLINQTQAREIDVRARRGQQLLFDTPARGSKQRKYDELLRTVVPLLGAVMSRPVPSVDADKVHRLDKFDTEDGKVSIAKALIADTVPYSELLYERMLGRPYASHRDSVSVTVGKLIEGAIKELCEQLDIPAYMPKSRDSIAGFPQAPDCLVPSKENAEVIIEAKLTEDDGTARDKVARLQTLRGYEDDRPPADRRTIVAVVDGRGFGHRSADLDRMLKACEGHVYTLAELPLLAQAGGPLHRFVGTKGA